MLALDPPWQTAFVLAWDSMLEGTTPVGAVVADASGSVVTTGRGRRYGRAQVPGQLSFSHLAHAELNALAQLSPMSRHEDHVVLTTLEPCLLCVGAAVMATVGRVEYAGADPYGGAAHLELKNAHTARLMPTISGPAEGLPGTLGALLHYAFYFERNPVGAVATAYRDVMPEFVAETEAKGIVREVLALRSERAAFDSVLRLFD